MLKAVLAVLFLLPYATEAARQAAPPARAVVQTQPTGAVSSTEGQQGDLADLRPKRVAVLMAMREEAEPLIQSLGLTEAPDTFDRRDPMRAFRGRIGAIEVVVVLHGKGPREDLNLTGPVAAAMATSQAVKTLSPDLVINAGTAGGFGSRGVRVGEVLLSRAIVFHDRHSPFGGAREAYALGNYPQPGTERTARDLGIKTAVVATGNSFVNVSTTDLSVIRKVDAAVVEMEAAAVAEVCAVYKVKMVALKAVTDDVEHPNVGQFRANLQLAATNLATKLRDLLTYLQRP
jgi:5'-methylthioadenosine nucleosidase